MNIVIDTNVWIAAFISPRGRSSELVEHCVLLHKIYCSEFILDELREKWIVKFRREPADVSDALALIRSRVYLVSPIQIQSPASRDIKDNPILGTAVAARAERIITGDKDLLSMSSFEGIRIVSPAEFLEEGKKVE